MNDIWVTTDWHLWSKEIKPQHPFRTSRFIENMIDGYRSIVQEDDILIHLGDIADPEAMTKEYELLKGYIQSIPGYKVLCKGNHDTRDNEYYIEMGFNQVCDICMVHNILFSHFPTQVEPDMINIHGHLHTGKWSTYGYQHINAYNTVNFAPMTVDQILERAQYQNEDEYRNSVLKGIDAQLSYYLEDTEGKEVIDISDMVTLAPMDETAMEEIEDEEPDDLLNEILFEEPEDTEYWMQDDNYDPSKKQKEPMAESATEESVVYFTKDISPDSLVRIYDILYKNPVGKTMVKISSGEPGGHNFLQPELIGKLTQHVNGTIADANTAYEGKRYTTKSHMKVMKDHGFIDIAPVDVLDADGEIAIPVENGLQLKEAIAGSHIADYNNYLILSHFKGHQMAGFGGAIKNVAIGISSSKGKSLVHTGGTATTGFGAEIPKDIFLQSMADAAKAYCTYMGPKTVYINIANNISVDCDCDAHPADPCMKDIGIFASFDPVAVDQAAIDFLYHASDSKPVQERIESRSGLLVLDYAEKVGLGSRRYQFVDIDETMTESADHIYPGSDLIINESIASALNKLLGKEKAEEAVDDAKISLTKLTNFKEPYKNWDMTYVMRNSSKAPIDTQMKLAEKHCKVLQVFCKKKYGTRPSKFKYTTGKDIMKEYNLSEPGRYHEEDWFIMCDNKSISPTSKTYEEFRQQFGARYFTDIIDNMIRVEMYENENYKPKDYIDMDNIKAADKYLKSMATKNETASELYDMSKEEKFAIADKYGLKPPGYHEEERETPEGRRIRLEKEEAKKKKQALKEKKRRDRINKIKNKLPGNKEKNESVVEDDSDGSYDGIEHNPLWGDNYRFFKNPDHNAEYLGESAHIIEPVEKILFLDRMNEAAKEDGKLYPVYVMLVHSGSALSTAIKNVTDSEFSHSSISFDISMKQLYSFGRKKGIPIGGFKKENIWQTYPKDREIPYAIYMVPCTNTEIERMKKRLDYFLKNETKFKYSFVGLLKNYFRIEDNSEYGWYCSRFVADILDAGRPDDPYFEHPSFVKPEDFKHTDFAYFIDGGPDLAKYDPKKAEAKTKKVMKSIELKKKKKINENNSYDLNWNNPYADKVLAYQLTKLDENAFSDFVQYLQSFKIRMDKDGNVIIGRREYDQLDKHFKQSVKLLRAYQKAGNVEGIKTELCKIYYMIELINTHYLTYKTTRSPTVKTDMRKAMLDLRAVMLNVFQQNLTYVTSREPKFNFQAYYDESKYSKNVKIPKEVVTAVGKAIVTKL